MSDQEVSLVGTDTVVRLETDARGGGGHPGHEFSRDLTRTSL